MKLQRFFSLFVFLVGSASISAQAWGATPRFAYVSAKTTNTDPGMVTAFTIDPNTGSLSFIGVFPAGAVPVVVRVDPSGRFVYAAEWGDGNIAAYTVDPSSGALTAVPGSPFGSDNYWEVAVDPTGPFVYAADGTSLTVSGYAMDPTSGALTPVPGSPFSIPGGTDEEVRSVQVDPSGRFVYAVNSFSTPPSIWEFTIDPGSGSLTQTFGTPFLGDGTDAHSMVIDPLGRFAYAENSGSGDVSAFTIDPTTGALTQVPGSPFPAGSYPRWVTVDQTGQFVYAPNFSDNTLSAYSIDPNTGALTAVPGSPFATGSGPISVTATDRFVYVANELDSTVNGYQINPDGSLTELSDSPYSTGGGACESITTTPGPQGPSNQ